MNISKRQFNTGVTLTEMVVVVAIIGLITVAIGAFQADIFKFNRFLNSAILNQQEARKLLRPFVSEIRGANQSVLGAFPLATVGTSTLVFYSDTNNDGLSERIRYVLENGIFMKKVTEPSGNPPSYDDDDEKIVRTISNVVNTTPIFIYFDETYNGISSTTPLSQPVSPAEVRSIKIELYLDDDPNQLPEPLHITSQATIRNLKDNL